MIPMNSNLAAFIVFFVLPIGECHSSSNIMQFSNSPPYMPLGADGSALAASVMSAVAYRRDPQDRDTGGDTVAYGTVRAR
jgi:hypothetical protein